MKLLRYGPPGQEKPGLLDDGGRIRDLSAVVPDIAGATLLPDGLARLRARDPATLPLVEGTPRLGPCVGSVGKFIGIGQKPPVFLKPGDVVTLGIEGLGHQRQQVIQG